jgi:glycosyltransferase involved in cell wall biosynthesis
VPRVLVTSFEVPGWGGASTAAEEIFVHLRARGVDARLLHLVEAGDESHFRRRFGESFANRRGLPDVATCLLRSPWRGEQPELAAAIRGIAPDVVLGVGFIAALAAKRAAPGRRLAFLTTGCQQAKLLIEGGWAPDLVTLERRLARPWFRPPMLADDEKDVIACAELVVPHCDAVATLLRAFHPHRRGRIYPRPLSFAPWIHERALPFRHLARDFAARDIDLLFVASSWSRHEKNAAAVAGLVRALPGARIHVVGEAERRFGGAVHHGLVTDAGELFALMGRARALVCPSRFDAAPGILFEGSALGCNLVASPNCGNAAICHDDLLAPGARVADLLPPVRRALDRRYEDRIGAFLEADASTRLLEILSALTRVPLAGSAATPPAGRTASRRRFRPTTRERLDLAARAAHLAASRRLSWWPIGLAGARRAPSTGRPPRVAYFTWRFPVLSQTFVHREMVALVEAGVPLVLVADAPEPGPGLDPEARSLLARARYLGPRDAGEVRRGLRRFLLRAPLRLANLALYVATRSYGPTKSFAEDGAILRDAVRLATVLEAERAEHVHAPWADRTALVARVAARLLRLPFSLQARAHDVHRESHVHDLREKLADAEFVVTNTEYNRRYLEPFLPPASRGRLVTIPNGIDLAQVRPPAAASSEPGPIRLLCVGRLVEQKGIHDLLRACRRLADRGVDFVCEIVGAAEPDLGAGYAVELLELHASLGLGEPVAFRGELAFDRVLERLEHADVFVLPCVIAADGSRDITPNAVIEAMAMKRPVVSTTVTALPEIVEDEVSGILVPPGDPAALAAALERLCRDPDLRSRLGERARARVEERFDLRRNVARRVELFRDPRAALAGPGARA